MQVDPLHWKRQDPHYGDHVENPLTDLSRITALTDPAERAVELGKVLNALPDITAELRALRQAAVLELRDAGWSYGRIGKALHLHRNRAQQIAEGRTAGGQGGGKKAEAE
jgi:hypothetical protein